MKIVLFQPEIPANTGNIVRTCSVTGTSLLLVRPLGFSTSDRMLKRSGLDYWDEVDIAYTDDLVDYLKKTKRRPLFFSSKATKYYTDADYQSDDLLIFGSETKGLAPIFHETWPDNFYRIPMKGEARCLNLSNSVSIVLYEALRQQNFTTLSNI